MEIFDYFILPLTFTVTPPTSNETAILKLSLYYRNLSKAFNLVTIDITFFGTVVLITLCIRITCLSNIKQFENSHDSLLIAFKSTTQVAQLCGQAGGALP